MITPQAEKNVYQYFESEDNFLVKLRMREGLDQAGLAALIRDVQVLADYYESAELIPKQLVLCLFDIPYHLRSVLAYYDQEECESIYVALEPLFDAILDLFSFKELD